MTLSLTTLRPLEGGRGPFGVFQAFLKWLCQVCKSRTMGAHKGYDPKGFVQFMRWQGVTPHGTQNTHPLVGSATNQQQEPPGLPTTSERPKRD